MRVTWDIFCRVVDNFGDIGVCWRLARQLVAEHDVYVRLWVDELNAFCFLQPAANNRDTSQVHLGVDVRVWPVEWQPCDPADVVIEAFACELPQAYIDAMAAREVVPLWINLEYLSAEEWVDSYHGLPSMQPRGLQKFFFFPGFTAQTGGLLRETGLLSARQKFTQSTSAQSAFLRGIGVQLNPNTQLISLFSYETPGLASWLDVLSQAAQTTLLLVPLGRVVADLQVWVGDETLDFGSPYNRGSLTIQLIPFVDQDDYDRLLWCCDFNVVRGEDSFVRAQWAGRPFLWQPYPQSEDTHIKKLDAFLLRYGAGMNHDTQAALSALWHSFSTSSQGGQEIGESWESLRPRWSQLTEHAENWCQKQSTQINISSALVNFYKNSI